MKMAWREDCHAYLSSNPGKVITRYQFSYLFGRTWARSMTPHNICKGFEFTGIYPVNRHKILPEQKPKPPTLCECTGLNFLTPMRTCSSRSIFTNRDDTRSESFDETLPSESDRSYERTSDPDMIIEEPFTNEELIKFQKRKEEGYDIVTDERYNHWLLLQKEGKVPVVHVQQSQSLMSKVLRASSMPPAIKCPTMEPKSSARES